MAYRIHHLNKKTGVTYVYESVSRWDKEKKQARSTQVCIGKLDKETGAFIPSKRSTQSAIQENELARTATATIVGPSLILDALSKRLGLAKLLKAAFPEDYQQILTMAYYLACQGGPLSHCEFWTKTHEHSGLKPLTSQRISEILGSISTGATQSFLFSTARYSSISSAMRGSRPFLPQDSRILSMRFGYIGIKISSRSVLTI